MGVWVCLCVCVCVVGDGGEGEVFHCVVSVLDLLFVVLL